MLTVDVFQMLVMAIDQKTNGLKKGCKHGLELTIAIKSMGYLVSNYNSYSTITDCPARRHNNILKITQCGYHVPRTSVKLECHTNKISLGGYCPNLHESPSFVFFTKRNDF